MGLKMECRLDEPTSVQFIKSTPDNIIELSEENLRNILMNDDVKDRYVSVISIAGAYRQGKSFLLNFLLRYLKIKYVEMRDVTDWLQPEDGPLKGFKWSSGSKRHTAGIHMWPEIFLADINGDKVAIILLDTQGSFDNKSTINDCAKIFALSTLISSVQIYNLMQNIKQYDLSHLELFASYGSLLKSDSAPFQNIWFLIRDWAYPDEHPYGDAGGLAYLEEVLSSDNAEVKNQVEHLKRLFEMTCFLLPYPGCTVATSHLFKGDLNEIDDDFKKHVQNFVTNLLSPEKLVLKSFNGQRVTAEYLMYFIQEYSKALEDESLPKVETIFKATVEAQHKSASCAAFKVYKKNMDCDVKYNPQSISSVEFNNIHNSSKMKALDHYDKMKKFDDKEVYHKYLCDLKKKISEKFKRCKVINDEKLERLHKSASHEAFELYKESMDSDVESCPQSLADVKLDKIDASNKLKAFVYYDYKVKKIDDKEAYGKYLDDLKKNMSKKFKHYIEINKKKRKAKRIALLKKAVTVVGVVATVATGIGAAVGTGGAAVGTGGAVVAWTYLSSLIRFGRFIPFR